MFLLPAVPPIRGGPDSGSASSTLASLAKAAFGALGNIAKVKGRLQHDDGVFGSDFLGGTAEGMGRLKLLFGGLREFYFVELFVLPKTLPGFRPSEVHCSVHRVIFRHRPCRRWCCSSERGCGVS